MKAFFLFFLLLPVVVYAGDPVSLSPETPMTGKTITIYYNPSAEHSVLRDPDGIDLYMLYWYTEGDPVFHSTTMEQSNEKWEAEIHLEDEYIRAVQFKFKSGEHSDNNNGIFWDFALHDNDGIVVADGYYALGRSWLPMISVGGLEMIRELNPKRASKYFAKEFERNPAQKEAGGYYIQTLMWKLRDADDPEELNSRGLTVAEKLYDQYSDDPDVLSLLIHAYRAFGDTEKSSEIREYVEEHYPDHEMIIQSKMGEIFQARDDKQQSVELAIEFIEKYPEAEGITQIATLIYLPHLVELGRTDEAIQWLENHPEPTPALYWHLSNAMVRENDDPEKLLHIAKKALELFEQHPPIEKPVYATQKDWEERKQTFIRMELGVQESSFYHTYATALWKNDDLESAMEYIKKAHDLTDGNNPRTNTRFVEILHAAGLYERALEIGRRAIIDNQAEEDLFIQLEKSYTALYETDEGFTDFIETAQNETRVSLRAKFADRMIEEPAPDFTLKRLNGDPVTLSDLEGKVVVLDFWATWCGPCISAFPHFQRVVDHFADNSDVVFLAINTWEGDFDEERIEKVQNFIEENEYTFSVLFDEDTVVSEYGVQGIPTRFAVDRDGNIRFEDRGFSGTGMYQDMVVQIEMLLDGYEPLTER